VRRDAKLKRSSLCGAPHNAEIGAAWSKRSNEGRDYLSVKLDDPSFTQPIYANLFDAEDGAGYSLIWSRSRKSSADLPRRAILGPFKATRSRPEVIARVRAHWRVSGPPSGHTPKSRRFRASNSSTTPRAATPIPARSAKFLWSGYAIGVRKRVRTRLSRRAKLLSLLAYLSSKCLWWS